MKNVKEPLDYVAAAKKPASANKAPTGPAVKAGPTQTNAGNGNGNSVKGKAKIKVRPSTIASNGSVKSHGGSADSKWDGKDIRGFIPRISNSSHANLPAVFSSSKQELFAMVDRAKNVGGNFIIHIHVGKKFEVSFEIVTPDQYQESAIPIEVWKAQSDRGIVFDAKMRELHAQGKRVYIDQPDRVISIVVTVAKTVPAHIASKILSFSTNDAQFYGGSFYYGAPKVNARITPSLVRDGFTVVDVTNSPNVAILFAAGILASLNVGNSWIASQRKVANESCLKVRITDNDSKINLSRMEAQKFFKFAFAEILDVVLSMEKSNEPDGAIIVSARLRATDIDHGLYPGLSDDSFTFARRAGWTDSVVNLTVTIISCPESTREVIPPPPADPAPPTAPVIPPAAPPTVAAAPRPAYVAPEASNVTPSRKRKQGNNSFAALQIEDGGNDADAAVSMEISSHDTPLPEDSDVDVSMTGHGDTESQPPSL
jgi:hypothetical protein